LKACQNIFTADSKKQFFELSSLSSIKWFLSTELSNKKPLKINDFLFCTVQVDNYQNKDTKSNKSKNAPLVVIQRKQNSLYPTDWIYLTFKTIFKHLKV